MTRNSLHNKRRLVVISLIAVALLLLAINLLPSKPIRTLVVNISSFFWNEGKSVAVAIKPVTDLTKNKSTLIKERNEFEKKALRVDMLKQENRTLKDENDTLRQALEIEERTNREVIPAGIIKKATERPFATLIVNRGTKDKIQMHDPVLSSANNLIGFVDQVFDEKSIVQLLSEDGRENRTEISSGIVLGALGEGNGGFSIEIPKGSIGTSTEEFLFPVGMPEFVIARSVKIESSEQNPFNKIIFQSEINTGTISTVFIIKNYPDIYQSINLLIDDEEQSSAD